MKIEDLTRHDIIAALAFQGLLAAGTYAWEQQAAVAAIRAANFLEDELIDILSRHSAQRLAGDS